MGDFFFQMGMRAVGLLILMIISYVAFCRHVRTLRFVHLPRFHDLLLRAPQTVLQLHWNHNRRSLLDTRQLYYPHTQSIVAYTMICADVQNVEIVSLLNEKGASILSIVSRDRQITWIDAHLPDDKELDDPTLPWALTPFEERLVYDIFLLARRHAKMLSR